jgi:hypothetical protein
LPALSGLPRSAGWRPRRRVGTRSGAAGNEASGHNGTMLLTVCVRGSGDRPAGIRRLDGLGLIAESPQGPGGSAAQPAR